MSWAVWIGGPPASGKSALARAVAAELRARGEPVHVLALDDIRRTVTPSPTGSDLEHDVLHRALVFVAALLAKAGVPVILEAVGHRRIWRDLARGAIARFAEVELRCPPEVRRQREGVRLRGHTSRDARAKAPGITGAGVEGPYEPSIVPELVVDTAEAGVAEAAARIVALTRRLAPPRPEVRGDARAGWAIWITGRPGSGKTAVAERVAEALAARGIHVSVLDLAAARAFLCPAAPAPEGFEEMAHRTLVHASRLLTEAGVAVIVDATAPRRAWREAARELIPCFAEVQLVCPAEICAERERAARWRLGTAGWGRVAGASGHGAAPDMGADYEDSLRPELVVHTNVHDLWSAVEQVLFLVHRLRRLAPINLEQA